jgi:hypothetical protein
MTSVVSWRAPCLPHRVQRSGLRARASTARRDGVLPVLAVAIVRAVAVLVGDDEVQLVLGVGVADPQSVDLIHGVQFVDDGVDIGLVDAGRGVVDGLLDALGQRV